MASPNKLPLITLAIIGIIVFLGFNIQKVTTVAQILIKNVQGGNKKYTDVKWQDLKNKLSSNQVSADTLNLLSRVYLKDDNEINEAIEIFNSSKDNDLRKLILQKLFYSNKKPRVKDILKNIAKAQDRQLSSIALRGLIASELIPDSANNDQWTNWQWSSEIRSLLDDAVNKNMYKLAGFSYFELLKLSEKYPDSMLTKGAIEYRNLIDGRSYFIYKDSNSFALRQPFTPVEEISKWKRFIDLYPSHPATDDAMVRIARSYEVQKDYQSAILWYYKASQAPDGDMVKTSKGRIFLLIDSIISSKEAEQMVNKSTSKVSEEILVTYLSYSKALNLVKENKLQDAYEALKNFTIIYKQKRLQTLDGEYIDSDSKFWVYIDRQVEDIKELQKIRSQPKSDKQLYEEGVFWFNRNLFTYNFLLGDYWGLYVLEKWEGDSTYTKYSITSNLIDQFWQKQEFRHELLKSIELFQSLLKDYPNSDLREKAEYSIGLNYYYLFREQWKLRSVKNAKERAVQAFDKFVKDFPKSSMADDALISIAFLEINKTNKLSVLEKLIREYPDGDRVKEAKKMLEDTRNNR